MKRISFNGHCMKKILLLTKENLNTFLFVYGQDMQKEAIIWTITWND